MLRSTVWDVNVETRGEAADGSPFPALAQLEAWGTEALSHRSGADRRP